jgi:hypothetical protein
VVYNTCKSMLAGFGIGIGLGREGDRDKNRKVLAA